MQLSLQWRHNGLGSVSNHQPHDCLLNRWLRRRSKKTSKLRVTVLSAGNSPGEFPAQMASNAENVSIWWRHHVITYIHRNFVANTMVQHKFHVWYNRSDPTYIIIDGASFSRPIWQIPQRIRQISHDAPFCNRNVHMCVHISVTNGVLWDIGLVYCWICELSLLFSYTSSNTLWHLGGEMVYKSLVFPRISKSGLG